MKNFSIQEWVSGDIDIESKYYRLLSYLQKSFKKSKYESAPVIRDLKNKMIDLYCEGLNYSDNEDRKKLISIARITMIKVYESIIKEKNQDIIKELGEQVHW